MSDTRLKLNQTAVPIATLATQFDQIEVKEYDLQGQGSDPISNVPAPSERRVGFIANDVQAAISSTAWTNIVGSKQVSEEEYLTLDYSRMVAILWGQVKELKARLVAIGG